VSDECIFEEDGLVYRYCKEIPSPEVKKDSLIYVFTTAHQGKVLGQNYERDVKSILVEAGPDSPKWRIGSPYTPAVDLPPQIKGWRMELLDFPFDVIEPYLTDISIAQERVDWLPDFYATMNSVIVTARARHIIETLDSGFSYFYPTTVRVLETGDPIPGERFHWIARRRMNDIVPSRPDPRPGMLPVWWGGGIFSDSKCIWEFHHNAVLRGFLKDLPFWGLSVSFGSFAMSAPVFKRLKSELFTGLVELECDDRYDEDCDRTPNVGHLW
jgi:hypothetical protein